MKPFYAITFILITLAFYTAHVYISFILLGQGNDTRQALEKLNNTVEELITN